MGRLAFRLDGEGQRLAASPPALHAPVHGPRSTVHGPRPTARRDAAPSVPSAQRLVLLTGAVFPQDWLTPDDLVLDCMLHSAGEDSGLGGNGPGIKVGVHLVWPAVSGFLLRNTWKIGELSVLGGYR